MVALYPWGPARTSVPIHARIHWDASWQACFISATLGPRLHERWPRETEVLPDPHPRRDPQHLLLQTLHPLGLLRSAVYQDAALAFQRAVWQTML